jgi:hypothetical protein
MSFTVILRPLDYGTATRGNQSLIDHTTIVVGNELQTPSFYGVLGVGVPRLGEKNVW